MAKDRVYVVMTSLNHYKNIDEVFTTREEADKWKEVLESHGHWDYAYVLDMPLLQRAEPCKC